MTTETRELKPDEFYLAEKLWEQYRGQKADHPNERIFGVFVEGDLVATARYTRHPDGVEMDCVFVPESFRGKGYARFAVEELIRQCGSEPIYIHSTIALISFYKTFGFYPHPRRPAPPEYKGTVLILFWRNDGLQCQSHAEEGDSGPIK